MSVEKSEVVFTLEEHFIRAQMHMNDTSVGIIREQSLGVTSGITGSLHTETVFSRVNLQ